MKLPQPCAVGPHSHWYKGHCFYCGRHLYRTHTPIHEIPKSCTYTRDHIIPRKWGNPRTKIAGVVQGQVFLSKIVPSCPDCNVRKGNQSAREFINACFPGQVKQINWTLIEEEENRFKEWKNANARVQMPEARPVRDVHYEPGSVLGGVSEV